MTLRPNKKLTTAQHAVVTALAAGFELRYCTRIGFYGPFFVRTKGVPDKLGTPRILDSTFMALVSRHVIHRTAVNVLDGYATYALAPERK